MRPIQISIHATVHGSHTGLLRCQPLMGFLSLEKPLTPALTSKVEAYERPRLKLSQSASDIKFTDGRSSKVKPLSFLTLHSFGKRSTK